MDNAKDLRKPKKQKKKVTTRIHKGKGAEAQRENNDAFAP